jgi:hypothetical protein
MHLRKLSGCQAVKGFTVHRQEILVMKMAEPIKETYKLIR